MSVEHAVYPVEDELESGMIVDEDDAQVIDDLDAFFAQPDEKRTQLLQELNAPENKERAQHVLKSVTADTFATAQTLFQSVSTGLFAILGSCGPLCGHALGSMSSMGALNGTLPGVGPLGGHDHHDHSPPPQPKLTSQSPVVSSESGHNSVFESEVLHCWGEASAQAAAAVFGFGLLTCILDGFFPTASAA